MVAFDHCLRDPQFFEKAEATQGFHAESFFMLPIIQADRLRFSNKHDG